MSTTASADATKDAGLARPTAGQSVLKAQHLQRVFIDGARRLDVLTDINLDIRAGEVAALVGRSGSGKSTLLHLLGLLDTPDDGEILIDNTPAGTLNERDRAYLRNHHIGFVFQHYFLLPEFSVIENILMPGKVALSPMAWSAQKNDFQKRAEALLELVGLSAQKNQTPRTLSGGERQRVSVARSLIMNPRLLLCDEPTGNLDSETGGHIMNLIFDVCRRQNTAVLIVTHDLTLAGRADRILRLDRGQLAVEK